MIFKEKQIKEIDHKRITISGIYRIYDDHGYISYVGISKNVFRRWKEHISLRSGVKNLIKRLRSVNIKTLKFEILFFCKDVNLLKLLERGYIIKYDSFYNGQNGDHGGSLTALDSEMAKKGGISCFKLSKGVHSLSLEQKRRNSSKAGTRAKELNKGIHAFSSEQRSKCGAIGGKTSKYIWTIETPLETHTSFKNEGLENLCNRINFPYSKARKIFYTQKRVSLKENIKIIRKSIENPVNSVKPLET
jgi:hypothetical protein